MDDVVKSTKKSSPVVLSALTVHPEVPMNMQLASAAQEPKVPSELFVTVPEAANVVMVSASGKGN